MGVEVHWQTASFLGHPLLNSTQLIRIPEVHMLAIEGLTVTEMYFKNF